MNYCSLNKRAYPTPIFVAVFIALAVLLCILPAADAKADVVASGTCGAQGDNLTWTLDDEGLLTISGSGAMADYYPSSSSSFGVMTEVNVGHVYPDPDKFYALGVTMLTAEGKATYYNTDIRYNVVLEDEYVGDKYLGWLFNYNISASGQFVVGTVDDNTRMLTEPDFGFVGGNDTGFVPLCPAGNRIEAETDERGCLSKIAYQAIDAANADIEGVFANYTKHSANAMKITEDTVIYEITAYTSGAFKSAALGDPADYIGVAFTADQISIFAWDDKDITVLFVVNPFSPGPNDGSAAPAPGEGGDESAPGNGSEVSDDFVSGMNAVSSRFLGETRRDMAESGAGQEQDAPWASLRSGIERVVIEDGVTAIGANAFAYCENLSELTLPASVTSIGDNAFSDCNSLGEVIFDDTAEQWEAIEIGEGNDILYDVSPQTLEEIASGTCGANGDNLTWVLYDNGKLTISGTGAMAGYSSGSAPWYSNRSSIKSIVIEDGVTGIGSYAFYYCTSLTSVTIPDSVTSIGSGAFYYCTSLTDVYYGSTFAQAQKISSAGSGNIKSATWHCTDGEFSYKDFGVCGENLTWTLDNDGVLAISGIGEMANGGPWGQNSSIKSVVIEDGVTSIGNSAFYYCTSLTSLTIPDSVTSIGNSAFYDCTALTDVYYGSTCAQAKKIAYGSSNSSLKSATWHCADGVFSYKDFGACGENLTWALDNDGVLTISGTGAMYDYSYMTSPWFNQSGIKEIIVENGVTSIGSHAFYSCKGLTSVDFSDSITIIGDHAFFDCSSLISITIPDNVTSIGNTAFYGCTNLSGVTITNWLFYTNSYDIFRDCPNLTVYGYSGTWLEGWAGDRFSSLGAAPNWIDGTYVQPSLNPRTTMHITSAEDLAWLAQYVNRGNSMDAFTVLLDADIDLSGKLWTAIGTAETTFGGTFDGQGHTISGMTVSTYEGFGGLFGGYFDYDSKAKICNLCLADAKITSDWRTYPIAYTRSSVIVNCGAWGWACESPYMESDLGWSSFDAPSSTYSYYCTYNNNKEVDKAYLQSAEFRDWINACPASGMYDWVADTDGSNGGFPRLSTQASVRTREDVAETVSPQNDVYDIYTPQQLGYVSKLVNGGNTLSGKTVRLMADLDLSGRYWIPMSYLSADFDGNGHSITGLKVGSEAFPYRGDAGLIGNMSGNVSSLTLAGEIISTGDAGLIAAESDGEIKDCHVSGAITSSYGNCGGLVGYNWRGIDQCSFSGSISGDIVGGIAGRGNRIYRCSAHGTLSGYTVGGICGRNAYIENCYSICSVTGSSIAGGIIGQLSSGSISNCYAGGSVSGSDKVGAFIGTISGTPTFENCYWNQDGGYTLDGLSVEPWASGGGEDLTGVTALTAEQMRQQSSFVGFDFTNIWAIDSSVNGGMPYLQQTDISGDGYTVTLTDYTKDVAAITGIQDGGTYSGETTFTVSCDNTCAVLYTADGENYTRLTGTAEDNGYSFTVDVTQNMTIVVALKGDVNLDGVLKNQDVTMAKAANLGKRTLSTLQEMVADVTGDGVFKNQDITKFKAALLGKTTLSWDL